MSAMHFAFELVPGIVRPRPTAVKPPVVVEQPVVVPQKESTPEPEKPVDSHPKKRKSKKYWTREEDELLVKLVAEHGEKKWASIAKEMSERTSNQLRTRYYNYLAPGLKNGPWSQQEDEIFLKCYQNFGRRWRQIARQLPGRSEMSIMLRCKHFFPELFRPASKAKKPRREDGVAVSSLTFVNMGSPADQAALASREGSDSSDDEEVAEEEQQPPARPTRRSQRAAARKTASSTDSPRQSLPGPSQLGAKALQDYKAATAVGSALSSPAAILSHPLLSMGSLPPMYGSFAGGPTGPQLPISFQQQLFGAPGAAFQLAGIDASRLLPPPRFSDEEMSRFAFKQVHGQL